VAKAGVRERRGREPMEASSLLPKPTAAEASLAFEGIEAGGEEVGYKSIFCCYVYI
jgi:hypothetical protein